LIQGKSEDFHSRCVGKEGAPRGKERDAEGSFDCASREKLGRDVVSGQAAAPSRSRGDWDAVHDLCAFLVGLLASATPLATGRALMLRSA
jgi:hypothetical protein